MSVVGSEGKPWAESFPEPVDYTALLSSFFQEKKDSLNPLSVTRKDLMLAVLEKHKRLKESMEKEKGMLESFISTWEPVLDEKRRGRDKLNMRVRELKELRSKLHSEMRAVREQFFSLMEKEEALEKEKERITQLKKEMDSFDWQIETQAVDLETERELLSRIKSVMEEMERINEEYQEKTSIQERLKALAEASGKRAAEADRVHMEFLDTVEKADMVHAEVTELGGLIRRARGRLTWLSHRIEFHVQAIEYWEKRLEMEEASALSGGGGGG